MTSLFRNQHMPPRPTALLLPALAALAAAGCARSGYVLRPGPPAWGVCAFVPRGQQARYTARLQAIADGPEVTDVKVTALRATLPETRSFSDFYAALCVPAGQGDISQHAYYYLLDTLAPLAVQRHAIGVGPISITEPPALIAPADSAVFDIYPRSTHLQWQPVDGAVQYLAEVEVLLPPPQGFRPMSEGTGLTGGTDDTFDFAGAQPGRWRVRALDAYGRPGPVSPWRVFRYLR